MRILVLLSLAVLMGCPDPSAPIDDPLANPGGEGAPPGGPPGPGGGAGGAAPMSPPSIGNSKFDVLAGEGVKLSGNITYAGTKAGAIHIDFLRPGENGSFPGLLSSITVEKLGPWEVEAPKGLGKVGVVGYVDVAGDGPNSDDPAARIADLIDVGTEPLTGLDLTLSDSPDLGEFTPGKGDKGPSPAGTPEGGAVEAPGGAAPVAPPSAEGGIPPVDGTPPPPPAPSPAPPGAPAPAK